MAQIHPGQRKANPEATCNGKARLEEALEKASKNKEKARYRTEIERRFV